MVITLMDRLVDNVISNVLLASGDCQVSAQGAQKGTFWMLLVTVLGMLLIHGISVERTAGRIWVVIIMS